MPQSDPVENGKLVEQMRFAVLDGEKNIQHVPLFIQQVIDSEAWKQRMVGKLPVKYERFVDFIRTAPLQGMGWNTDEDIKRVESLLRYSPDVLRKWRKAMTAEPGHPMVPNGNNIPNRNRPHRGTSLAWTLDRLKREHSDLYDNVVAGKMSANAAAIKAGFRKRPTAPDRLQKDWEAATVEQQEAFLRKNSLTRKGV